MALFVRRSLFGATGATLAAALLGRKLAAQTILTPLPEPEVHLNTLDHMDRKAPPEAPPAQGFADADGKPVSLADFTGRGIVLNLWATWCVPCVAEMPALDSLAKRLASDDITILPLSSDRGGAPVVQKFYAAHGIAHLGTWIDNHGMAARAWGARGLPTTLIINRQGLEVARLEGAIDWSTDSALSTIRSLV